MMITLTKKKKSLISCWIEQAHLQDCIRCCLVLDEIVGQDYNDKATIEASKYIPHCGNKQFLKVNGLKGKRLEIARKPFYNFGNDTFILKKNICTASWYTKVRNITYKLEICPIWCTILTWYIIFHKISGK